MENFYEYNRQQLEEYLSKDFSCSSQDFISKLMFVYPERNNKYDASINWNYFMTKFDNCSNEKKEILVNMLSNIVYLHYKYLTIFPLENDDNNKNNTCCHVITRGINKGKFCGFKCGIRYCRAHFTIYDDNGKHINLLIDELFQCLRNE